MTPEEEQITRLPREFTWKEVGFRHREVTERTRIISEARKELTGSPVVTQGVMGQLAIEQYHLTLLTRKLEAAIIERAHSQMEPGGVITQYATARQKLLDLHYVIDSGEGTYAEQLADEAQTYLKQYLDSD